MDLVNLRSNSVVDKLLDILNHHLCVGKLLENIKSMKRILVHLQRRHLLPTLLQPLTIPLVPVLQRIIPAANHQRRRKLHARQIHPIRPHHVRRPVVPVSLFRQEGLPHFVGPPHIQHQRLLQPQLRLRPLHPAVERHQLDQPYHSEALELFVSARFDRHVVRDVPSRAVSREET
uniref:Uncharacterized protein n=1 Tax=Kalanchoe fedtschenkoi TaxID=63787 RepID=A0A7N0ZYB5_KALFE